MVGLKHLFFVSAAAALLGSCGKDSDPQTTSSAVPGSGAQQAQRMKSGDLFDDDSQKMLGRYGAGNPTLAQSGGSVAGESGQANTQYDREIANREFAAKDYTKKAFWGDKDYAKKVYNGDLDGSRFQQASRLGEQGAQEGTMMSRESGRGFDAAGYETGMAREQGGRRIERISDSETDIRRKVYKQPEITGWREQRALTVDDTNRLLGR